ncbi:Uncharacterized protein APZ42_031533, partial [Daphnia magna]
LDQGKLIDRSFDLDHFHRSRQLCLHQKRSSSEKQVLKTFANQNHYLRVMARELADIKAEQGDWRRLLFSNQSLGGIEENNGESRHPAFQKHVSLPLKTKADFKHFEEEE